jgi:hypothetical protein
MIHQRAAEKAAKSPTTANLDALVASVDEGLIVNAWLLLPPAIERAGEPGRDALYRSLRALAAERINAGDWSSFSSLDGRINRRLPLLSEDDPLRKHLIAKGLPDNRNLYTSTLPVEVRASAVYAMRDFLEQHSMTTQPSPSSQPRESWGRY